MLSTTRKNGNATARIRLNAAEYGRLLATVRPAPIENQKEYTRLLALANNLINKGEGRTPEETTLLKLLVHLIESYEQKTYQPAKATPLEVLQELMAANGLKQSDLWPIFGSKSVASKVMNGKRGISKAHAKALAEFFHVSADLFI